MSETSHAQPVPGRIDERFDNPLERLRLLAGDDDAIASFLDELDVQSPRESNSRELKLLRPARFDANALVEIMRSREIGVPSFVLAGLLLPLGATIWRLMSGFHFDSWAVAILVGAIGVAIGVGLSWIVLRGCALASARIRLSVWRPLTVVWEDVGWCGRPPRDGVRTFAIVAIVLMVGVWIVLPGLVALALAT